MKLLNLLAEIKVNEYYINPPIEGTSYKRDSEAYDEALSHLKSFDLDGDVKKALEEVKSTSKNCHETFCRAIYQQGLKDGVLLGKEIKEIL